MRARPRDGEPPAVARPHGPRLRHFGHHDLDRVVASAVAKRTGRGWRLDKADRTAQIDVAVAHAAAVEAASVRPEPVRLLGWL
jgi:hypothetical protein